MLGVFVPDGSGRKLCPEIGLKPERRLAGIEQLRCQAYDPLLDVVAAGSGECAGELEQRIGDVHALLAVPREQCLLKSHRRPVREPLEQAQALVGEPPLSRLRLGPLSAIRAHRARREAAPQPRGRCLPSRVAGRAPPAHSRLPAAARTTPR